MQESFFNQVMNSMKDTLGNAEKIYGFNLVKTTSDNYKSGFYFAVRYKDLHTNTWYP